MEVIEIVDNRTAKVLFTLRSGEDQDYILIDEYGLIVPSVSVYHNHIPVEPVG